ncbi:peptidase M23 [Catellatospora coxensis]
MMMNSDPSMYRVAHPRRPAGGLVLLLTAAILVIAAPAAAQAAPRSDAAVVAAVTARLLHQSATSPAVSATGDEARITVTRRNGSWAFGTAVLVAPHTRDAHPTGSIFVARAEAGRWQVAFDGEPAFSTLAADSPVVTETERKVFATPPHLRRRRLPHRNGAALRRRTDVDTDRRTARLGRQRIAVQLDRPGRRRPGRAGGARRHRVHDVPGLDPRHPRPRLLHRLLPPVEQHLRQRSSRRPGAFLGYTGTDVTCGGAASGRHVHFGLRQNSAYVPIGDHGIGKWVFVGGAAYQGGARHGSAWAGPGSGLYNYGVLGFTQGVVDANGGGTLTRRSGPGTGYAAIGSLSDGATVSISCSANGTTHTGRYGATALWNRLTDGSWVSDAFLWTGVNGAINGWC